MKKYVLVLVAACAFVSVGFCVNQDRSIRAGKIECESITIRSQAGDWFTTITPSSIVIQHESDSTRGFSVFQHGDCWYLMLSDGMVENHGCPMVVVQASKKGSAVQLANASSVKLVAME